MNQKKRDLIFDKLAEHIQNPTTELNYQSGFELLVAVVLSAQATDISVNKATKLLFAVANTPQQLISLGVDGIKSHIKTIGLYNSKANNVWQLCHQLLERHQGEVPNNRKDLQALAGVGRKTANVILNTLFGEPTIAVDTHLFRLSNRIPLARGKTELAVEKGLLKYTPKRHLQNVHHLLILHGRYTCTAKKPACGQCVIYDECEYPLKS